MPARWPPFASDGTSRSLNFSAQHFADFDGGSDLDFLYTSGAGFRRELAYGPWAQNRMAEELSELLGRKVDLIERSQIEKHRNWIRREHILSTAQPIYVEG